MFRSLADIRKEESKDGKGGKKTESYTGGEKSGMAVENPDDIEGVIKQAKENSEKNRGSDKEKPDTEVRITLYQNGFQVDRGEFREYDTPENKAFMAELNKGYVPEELRKKYNKQIGVALEDRRKDKFRPPTPPKYVAYQGAGQSISETTGVGGAVNKDSSDGKPVVDENQPKTTIQIRFHNGERASLTLNLTHTVSDIHAYVMNAAPVDGEYALVSGFPPKPLSDPSKTIEQAGLKNSAITQKIV